MLITPGMRVVVRYRLPDGRATDALGTLLSADQTHLVVDAKRGVERIAVERGIEVRTAGLEALDKIWDEVKAAEGT